MPATFDWDAMQSLGRNRQTTSSRNGEEGRSATS